MTAANAIVPRLPEKEAELVAVLRAKPQTLGELLNDPFVRRKIGRGYVRPILRCLLDEDRIAVTNGIFWARAGHRGIKPCAKPIEGGPGCPHFPLVCAPGHCPGRGCGRPIGHFGRCK